MRKNVAFPLSDPETIQEDANPVRGAMDFGNQAKRLSRHEVRLKLCVLHRFPARAPTFGIGQFPSRRRFGPSSYEKTSESLRTYSVARDTRASSREHRPPVHT